MKILVTGGAGFIGSTLVDRLIALGHQVVIIDDLSSGKKEYLNPEAKFYQMDLTAPKIEEIFNIQKFDIVYHLAAQIDVRKSVANPAEDNRINVLGGINILANCAKYGVKKIIFSSTGGAIYGETESIPTTETCPPNPLSPYGIHKLTFEKYLNYYHQVYGQKYTILRFANVYGPRQYKGGEAGVVSIFVENAVNGKKSIINGDGLQTRDYVYVDDVVAALVRAMDVDYNGALNVGTGIEKNLIDVMTLIELSLGKRVDKEHAPAKLGEQMRSCLSCAEIKKVLGWEPQVDLATGIKRTVEWTKSVSQ
ncbi:MAG: NAD-dependent epimerase/dehydratase family protein [Candidatus Falkowbacteria bacterium]